MKPPQKRRAWVQKRTTGFTLMELVVVVGIVAALTAILLPVFGRTNCDERRASCGSNMKQIALSLAQYSEDYSGRFIHFAQPETRISTWHSQKRLGYYIGPSRKVFRCPTAPPAKGIATRPGDPAETTYALPGDDDRGAKIKVLYSTRGRLLTQVAEPERTWMLLEARSPDETLWREYGYGSARVRLHDLNSADQIAQVPNFNSSAHRGGFTVVAFLDGHVKAIRPQDYDKWGWALHLRN